MATRIAFSVLLAALASCMLAPGAGAAFPGVNGRLAYTTFGFNPGIGTINYDGSDPQHLTVEGESGPRWSPDGSRLVFAGRFAGPGIWLMNADGSGQQRIRPSGDQPAWSPDGTKIVFADGNPRRLWIMNSDGTGAAQLPVDSDAGVDGELQGPAWSPDGQRIAYLDLNPDTFLGRALYLVNPDGSGRSVVYRYADGIPGRILSPEWLPDGSRVAYIRTKQADNFRYHLLTVRPDGTGEVDLGWTGSEDRITWSPDGTLFALGREIHRADGSLLRTLSVTNMDDFESWQPVLSSAPNLSVRMYRDPRTGVYRGDTLKYTAFIRHVTGSSPSESVAVTVTPPGGLAIEWVTSSQGSCEIDGQTVTCQLGTISPGAEAAVAVSTTVTSDAGVSLETTATAWATGDPDPLNNEDTVTFVVSGGTGYVHPKSAPTLDISLVPAYAECTGPNRTHGPPLAFGSCNPPAPASNHITIGTPAQSVSSAHVRAVPANSQTGAAADVRLTVLATDVRRSSDLADYMGELQAAQTLRITDRLNPAARGTMADYVFRVTMPCTATASTSEGASCAVATTANAVIPNAVRGNIRSVWDWGAVKVFDGGPDGVASTLDNSLFLTQGLFVP